MAQRFHKSDVERHLKALCRKLKRVPLISDVKEEHFRDPTFPSYATVVYYFGGMPPWLNYYFDTEVKGQGELFAVEQVPRSQRKHF